MVWSPWATKITSLNKLDKMNTAAKTDKRQGNTMIKDCYNGNQCIINDNILVNAYSFSASSPLYAELSQSHWGQDTAGLLTLHMGNKMGKHLPTILHLSPRNGWQCEHNMAARSLQVLLWHRVSSHKLRNQIWSHCFSAESQVPSSTQNGWVMFHNRIILH